MLKLTRKILISLSLILLVISQQGCQLDDEYYEDPIIPEFGTGMWFVSQLNTGGDARFVKGKIIAGTQYAFIANGTAGLAVVNISNGTNPTIVSNFTTNGFAKEVFIDTINGSHYVFISDNSKGLFILNVSNPGSLVLDTNISYTSVNSVNRKGNNLFVALNDGVVKVLDVSQLPNAVNEVASYNAVNIVERIEVSGNIAYFVENITGIEIVNVSDPLNLNRYSTIKPPGDYYDIKIANDIIYVADGNVGLSVINASNPAQPYYVGSLNTETNVKGVDYSPNFLFIAEGNLGVQVLNVFNPVYPESVGYYEPGNHCYSINYFKAKVLVANGNGGLLILRF